MQKRRINPTACDSTIAAVPSEGASIDKFTKLLLHKLNLTLCPQPKPHTGVEKGTHRFPQV